MRRTSLVLLSALALAGLATLTGCVPAGPLVPGTACPMFPADNHWHAKVSALPARTNSAAMITRIGSATTFHADFGSGLWNGGPIGIPYVVVPVGQAKVSVTFDYADESDPGPYPIPGNPPIEGGSASTGDRHVLIVDQGACRLYELYDAHKLSATSWHAGSGATWDLQSNALRPATWTSADAAGLPILPGLVRYDEVASGHVDHAIRMTVPVTNKSFLWPARHQAGSTTDPNAPAMGQRFRLRSTVREADFPAQVRPIIMALKTYGAIIADNGSAWYLSGVPDPRWDNDALHTLGRLTGADLVAVDASSLMVSANSGEAHPT